MAVRRIFFLEDRWQSLVMNAPNMILIIDRDFQIQFVNRPKGFLLDHSSALASLAPDYQEPARQVILRVFNQGEAGSLETPINLADGQQRWFELQAWPITEQERVTRAALICSDITAKKDAERALAQRLELEQKIAALSADFIARKDINVAIDNALRQVGELRKVDRVSLLQIDRAGGELALTHEWAAPGVEPIRGRFQRMQLSQVGLTGPYEQITRGKPLVVDDIDQAQGISETERELSSRYGAQAFAVMPLIIAGEIAGMLSMNSSSARHWLEGDVSLLKVVTGIMGNALEQARAAAAERAALHQSEVLRMALTALTSELDQEIVLGKLLLHLEKLVSYDLASVILMEGGKGVLKAYRGDEELYREAEHCLADQHSLVKRLLTSTEIFYLRDFAQEDEAHCSSALSMVSSMLGVPLRSHGQILGYMVILSKKVQAFGERDLQLVQAFADQAAIGIENAQLYMCMREISIMDELTQLYNRRHFFELAHIEISRNARYKLPLTAVMIDVDKFKKINDTYGHATGDQVLREVAARLKQGLRVVDVLGRYGGEEFAVLLPQTTLEDGKLVADRLRVAIGGQEIRVSDRLIRVTVSLGLSECDASCQSLDELLTRADRAMYQAKVSGGNRVELYARGLDSSGMVV